MSSDRQRFDRICVRIVKGIHYKDGDKLGSVCKKVIKLFDMGNRGDLTNEQWEQIEQLLRTRQTKRGRPAQDHRQLLNDMIWVLRTGAPSRDIPERYGTWTTIYSRFRRWCKSGVWDKMCAELQTALDVESSVDWGVHFIDSTIVRAHQHAAGAKK